MNNLNNFEFIKSFRYPKHVRLSPEFLVYFFPEYLLKILHFLFLNYIRCEDKSKSNILRDSNVFLAFDRESERPHFFFVVCRVKERKTFIPDKRIKEKQFEMEIFDM